MENAAVSNAATLFNKAYLMHYKRKELEDAIQLYLEIVDLYPNDPEASYSKVQVENIVAKVVPEQELFEMQVHRAIELLQSPEGIIQK